MYRRSKISFSVKPNVLTAKAMSSLMFFIFYNRLISVCDIVTDAVFAGIHMTPLLLREIWLIIVEKKYACGIFPLRF